MSRWSGVEEFVEIVNCGSFTAAAKRLGVSTSHVSRQVDALEQRLSTRLLYRTTRQVNLTEMGKVYYEHCNNLLEGFSDAEAIVTQLQTEPQGLLRVTAPATFGEQYIAPLANDFIRLHPKLNVEFSFSNDVVDVIQEGYDLAIRTGVLKDSTLMARRLAHRRLFLVASPEYINAYGEPKSLAELHTHIGLMGEKDAWSFYVDGASSQIKVKGRWQSNSEAAQLDAALKGMGLAQLPDYQVLDKINKGELISVLDDYSSPDPGVWAVYPYNRNLSVKVRLFVDYLTEQFEKGLPWLEMPN